ncbi:hypothetical protein D3C87_2047110 [compost metagenome]
MHRTEFVNMRQHCPDPARPRLETVEPQQRIEPDQPPARTVQPVHLMGELLDIVALQSVGDQ